MATKLLTDAVMPYKKTPINIAKTGLSYSPLQLAKSVTYDIAQLKKGNITVNQYIDNISKGLTGTGIALIGYALANAGILKASGSDDKDKESYDEDRGNQTYSIKIGDSTYSLDWIAPTGIPLFVGAEMYEIMNASKEVKTSASSDDDTFYNQALKTATNILDAFTNAMNPMTEMSMLSGLTSAIKSYDGDSSKMLANIGANAVKSYVNQFVPTGLSQIARTSDEYERSTTSTKTGILPKAIDSTKNYIFSKIPGLRQTLPVKTDIWGNDVKQAYNVVQRALENAVFPWTRKDVSTNDVDSEIMTVYDNTGESSVLPDSINKNLTINKQKYIMTSEEYSKYKRQYGQNSYELLSKLIKSSDYKNMNNTQKKTAIEKIYNYANEQIKIDYAKENELSYEESTLSATVNAIKKAGGNTSNYFEYIALTQDMEKNSEKIKMLASARYASKTKSLIYENSIGKQDETYPKLKENNVTINDYLNYKNTLNDTKQKKIVSGELTEEQDLTDNDKINLLLDREYSSNTTTALYENCILSSQDETYPLIKQFFTDKGLNINKYLEYKTQGFESDKKDDGTVNGKSISGSKKKKVYDYVADMKISYTQRLLLLGTQYKLEQNQRTTLFNYINSSSLKNSEKLELFGKIQGFTVYKDGTVKW